MVGARGFESLAKPENQPQNSADNIHVIQNVASEAPDDPDLKELCNLWNELSPEVKRLLLLMARDGGKVK